MAVHRAGSPRSRRTRSRSSRVSIHRANPSGRVRSTRCLIGERRDTPDYAAWQIFGYRGVLASGLDRHLTENDVVRTPREPRLERRRSFIAGRLRRADPEIERTSPGRGPVGVAVRRSGVPGRAHAHRLRDGAEHARRYHGVTHGDTAHAPGWGGAPRAAGCRGDALGGWCRSRVRARQAVEIKTRAPPASRGPAKKGPSHDTARESSLSGLAVGDPAAIATKPGVPKHIENVASVPLHVNACDGSLRARLPWPRKICVHHGRSREPIERGTGIDR